MSILVSISCITYNHEKYIAQAIESLLMQKTGFEYEILIHDDASTDRTADIIREYERNYPNIIKPIYQTVNQYSRGIRKIAATYIWPRSRGKYIALCEGDDYWIDPYKLQNQVDYMKAHPECTMCFHATELVKEDGFSIGIIKRPYNYTVASPEDIILGGGDFCHTSSIIFLKKIMDKPPQFYLDAPVGDYALRLACISQGYGFYIDKVMSAYRRFVPGSWTERVQKVFEENRFFHLETIHMLKSFNDYSEGKFQSAVDRQIKRHEVAILLMEKDRKCLKEPKNKEILKFLSFKEKLKVYLGLYFPLAYATLAGIKHIIYGWLFIAQKVLART